MAVQNKNYFTKHYSVRGSNNFRVQMFLQLAKLLAKLLDKSLCCLPYNSKWSNTRASIYLFQLMYQIFDLAPNNFTPAISHHRIFELRLTIRVDQTTSPIQNMSTCMVCSGGPDYRRARIWNSLAAGVFSYLSRMTRRAAWKGQKPATCRDSEKQIRSSRPSAYKQARGDQ